jgi:tetratricopeptide (TPR) repeat protein
MKKMNGKKMLTLAIAVFACVAGVFANNNERGIDLYRAELFDAAKIFFLEPANLSPQEQAERYYYLGRVYFALGQIDLAAQNYELAVQTMPDFPFGYIGQGKLALAQGDARTADALFKKAIGLAKKDPSVQIAIANVYIEAGMNTQATAVIAAARKINKRYAGIYVAEGNMAMKANDIGKASSWFEQAILFDPTNKIAHLNLAQVYRYINPDEALRHLERLKAIDANYIPAYALIGDINRERGMYNQALAAYEKFISIPGVPLLQHERFAQLLYFTDQFERSLQEIERVLQQDPENVVMHRLRAYNNFKLENYAVALEQMSSFLQKTPVDQHIYLDYMTYGRILMANKQPELAVNAFEKAAKLDPTPEVFRELIAAYQEMNNYPEIVRQWERLFEVEQTPGVMDFFNFGRANYQAASRFANLDYLSATISSAQRTTDDAEFQAFFDKGDAAFAEVIRLMPNSPTGYLWRAHLSSLIDLREQSAAGGVMPGAAKPFYEEALPLLLANNEGGVRNNDIITAYRYLASYYILLDDKATAGEFFKKILEIDSTNTMARDALNQLGIRF